MAKITTTKRDAQIIAEAANSISEEFDPSVGINTGSMHDNVMLNNDDSDPYDACKLAFDKIKMLIDSNPKGLTEIDSVINDIAEICKKAIGHSNKLLNKAGFDSTETGESYSQPIISR